MTRAVDALEERIEALFDAVAPTRYRDHHTLTFHIESLGQDHRVVLSSRGRDAAVAVDATGAATLGLVGAGYPEIVVALRRWADRVEAYSTE